MCVRASMSISSGPGSLARKVNTEVKMEVERREMRSRRLTEHAASVLSWVKVVALSADFDCLRGGVGPPAIMREEWKEPSVCCRGEVGK